MQAYTLLKMSLAGLKFVVTGMQDTINQKRAFLVELEQEQAYDLSRGLTQ